MPKASPIQTSFNAGELTPRLEGRVDLAKYANGVRTLQNFMPLVQGPALKRSGTKFVKEVKDSADEGRLIPFQFGTAQAYVLEFGDLYFRVYYNSGAALEATIAITGTTDATPIVATTGVAHGYENGDQVWITGVSIMTSINDKYFTVANKAATTFELSGTSAPGGGAGTGGTCARVPTVTTTYAKADLDGLQWAQSADVLYLAHPSYPPRKIERTSDSAWTITDIDFDWQPFSKLNDDEDMKVNATAVTGTGITLFGVKVGSPNTGPFTSDMVDGYFKLEEIIQAGGSDETAAGIGVQVPWAAGSALQNSDAEVGDRVFHEGNVYEVISRTGRDSTTASTDAGMSPPSHTEGTFSDGQWMFKYLHSGAGYVKITAFTDEFTVTADVIHRLPESTLRNRAAISLATNADPAVFTTGNHGLLDGEKVWISGVTGGTWDTVLDDLEFTVTVSSTTQFTLQDADGVDVDGTGLGSISAGNVDRRGTDFWAPGAFSDERGYPRGVTIHEDRLWWAGTSSDPQSLWASITSDYEDHKTTDEDESALLLTLNANQINIIEWIHSASELVVGTAGGEFLVTGGTDAAITPGNARAVQQTQYGVKAEAMPVNVEQVTLFVQKAGRKLREYVFDFDTNSRIGPDLTVLADHIALDRIKHVAWQQEPFRILWCVLEDGELIGLTYERSQEVVGWHKHVIGGTSVTVESIAVIPHENLDRDQLWLLVKRTIDGGTKRYVEYMEEDWLRTNDITDARFSDSFLVYDDTPTVTIDGLEHLEGEVVKVLGDGIEQDDQTVSSGSITITSASTVQVGLAYEAVLETMRLEAGAADGTAQGKTKRIHRLVVRLDQTGKGLKYSHEDVAASYFAFQDLKVSELKDGDTDSTAFTSGYEQPGRVVLKHDSPLPCTITAIMPQLNTQDR